MPSDTCDFDMMVNTMDIDVILGDGTQCMLNFPETTQSPYLSRLLSIGQQIALTFGTAAALRELKAIVAHQQRWSASQSSGTVCDSERSDACKAGNQAPLSARTVRYCSTNLNHEEFGASFHARVRALSEDRKLFMEVLELATRFEMEDTIPVLCDEFRRIFDAEVRPQAKLCVFGALEGRAGSFPTLSEGDLRAFRQCVIGAFALGGARGAAERPDGRRSSRDDSWVRRLGKDRYFFAAPQDTGDLTQSVHPQLSPTGPPGRACFGDFEAGGSRHPFQCPTWEADDAAKSCALCKGTFASWSSLSFKGVRPTHCRCCGRRVCTTCSPYQLHQSIARLSKPGGPAEGSLRRACKECCEKAEHLNKHAFLCEVFIRGGLTLTEIALLRSVNENWRGAAELCLSDYRSVLYHCASRSSDVPPQTAQLLANSVGSLVGHPEALCFHLMSLNWSDEQAVAAAHDALCKTINSAALQSQMPWMPQISHWHMLCTRACALMIPSFFAIKLLEALHRAPDGNSTAEAMRVVVTTELLSHTIAGLDGRVRECLVPMLFDLFDLSTCQLVATTVLFELARLDRRLAIVICQESLTRSSSNDLNYHTLRNFILTDDQQRREEGHKYFLRTLDFLHMLTEICLPHPSRIAETRSEFRKRLYIAGLTTVDLTADELNGGCMTALQPMFFPFDTNVIITHVDVDHIEIMPSKQRPFTIPLIDSLGKTRRILYKRESLEKDKVLCITSRFLQWVLQKNLRRVEPPTYHVLSLTSTSGVIEIVEEGCTVQRIIEQYKDRLLQYLLRLEEDQKQELSLDTTDLQKRRGSRKPSISSCFLYSAKFFILLNYIFAIGDRHRDNVMVHPSGAIFHIDFGMLLNKTTLEERITASYVRFDCDLEECVLRFTKDGSSSLQPEKQLNIFFMETAAWFLDVRPYVGILYQLLSHVVYRRALDGVDSPENLAALVSGIFMRDAAEETCKYLFCERVKKSRGRSWLKDLTHDTHKRAWGVLTQSYQWVRQKTGLQTTPLLGGAEENSKGKSSNER